MLAVQDKVDLTITTPLGKDALILDKFDGVEQISAPFCFSLEMHSPSPSLDLSALVGKEVQITYKYGKEKRYFCGIVGAAEQGWTVRKEKNNFTFYQAKVYPKFWLLKFTRDHRIFQNKSAMDIIKQVLSENGVTEIEDKTSSCGKGVREYCVQYAESCFDFVSRLMEEEGIFYFFKHTNSTHKMVISDDSKDAKAVNPEKIPYLKSYSGAIHFNVLHTIRSQEQVVAKKFAATDFNFKTPTMNLYNKVSGEGAGGEVYHYPGLFMKTKEGDVITNHRLQDLEWAKITLKGSSTVPLFCPMHEFSMADHPRATLNKKYVLYRVHHRMNQDATSDQECYANEFVAFPATVPFRPERVTPKPLIHSTQTAIVTTKAGEEIWCDEFGRIKVHFHWDQRGTKDEKSSCWIRVAQLWAGNNWGGLFTPRVGMEVVVTFLDGDPDRPLITGCVYNGQNASPYSKAEPTKSTIKSNSTKGGGGFNEFRFEDKKGSEEIYTHAQKDQNTVVEHSRTLLIKTGDDTSTIKKGQRLVTLNGGDTGHDTLILDKGNRMVDLKGSGTTHTLSLTDGNNIIHIKKGNETTTLDKGNRTVELKGPGAAHTLSITNGDSTIKISKGNQTTKLGAGNMTIDVTGNINIKATGNITLQSTGMTTVKAAAPLTLQSSAVVNVKAAGPLNLDSAAMVNVKSAGMLNLQSASMINLKTAALVNVESGSGIILKSPLVNIKGALKIG
jgi:type VI secretion system secreted protein VgrG